MYTYYFNIFEDPNYPIIENREQFNIFLVDEMLPPPKRKLYPSSEPELNELYKYIEY